MLQQEGAVSTSGLVEKFQVSVETIRRDLLILEQAGVLNRVHGGAVLVGGMQPFNDLKQRNEEHNSGKKELAEYACRLIQDGDYIAIDAGSTAVYLAYALKEHFQDLTVVTYSMDVFEILGDVPGFRIILCGGFYLNREKSFYGNLTLDILSRLRVQKAFICPSAVSHKFGICDYQQEIFLNQQKLLEISDAVFVLADSSKFEKKALLKLDDMNPEYWYITDSQLSAELKKLYQENNLKIWNREDWI